MTELHRPALALCIVQAVQIQLLLLPRHPDITVLVTGYRTVLKQQVTYFFGVPGLSSHIQFNGVNEVGWLAVPGPLWSPRALLQAWILWTSAVSALPLGQCFRWVSAESVLPCVGGRTAGDVLGFCGPPLTVNAPHVFDLTSPPPSSFANPRPSPLFAQIYVRLDTSFLCTMPGPALRRSDKVCRSHHPLHEL